MASTSEVECSGLSRDVWLVKVPKFLSNLWMEKADETGIVGSLRISQNSQKNEIKFNLAESLAGGGDSDKAKVPRDYRLLMSKVDQSLVVFSKGQAGNGDTTDTSESDKISLEGKVVQRADCRPINSNAEYMLLKRESILSASKPARQAKQLKKIVTSSYKPVSDHKMNIEYEKKKKEEGKRARSDEEEVKAKLFHAFGQHQYYNLKDLVHITNQPIVYLKSILKEIAHYNTKNPHKNMWELKPEYRHYEKHSDDDKQS
ncbi:general transcription factor IIF subunit 2 [Exaiptasia diaphana]|uniref:General transcription factor IIF subunit 2 n=1 Tax=Exaiptasia diaphana TaxID=2652724 RepID=A0A913XQY8_EXADI|nr:general transcription factor IIF subunit 2 [Exaiptasia diaphana]KXJ24910.1 General transcription factor IIF subunit 2 [Exaiptasia diaphana]